MTNPRSPYESIGLDELKRRVGEALEKVNATIENLPENERPTTVKQFAECVGFRLDQETYHAVFREGLVRIVRRVMRANKKRANQIKQRGAKRGEKAKDEGGGTRDD